ncbi:MAG: hypothetical protein AAF497_14945, partial [Planctomycetota bacterium]
MTAAERTFNYALAATLAVASCSALVSHWDERPPLVLLAVSALNFFIAWLFATRDKEQVRAKWSDYLLAIPGVLLGGWVYSCAPAKWSLTAQAVFLMGAMLTIAAFAHLGRSFAV